MDNTLMTQPSAATEKTKGSTTHVAALFDTYHEAIFGYLYRLLDDAQWAHDLTQETFLRVHRSRQRLADVANERAWIYRIASNLAFNALKRRRRYAWLPWRDGDAAEEPALITANPAGRVREQAHVAYALSTLSPTYRAPLLLYTRYDFSVREIARALDIGESAVKTRLFRARQMFRDAYAEWE